MHELYVFWRMILSCFIPISIKENQVNRLWISTNSVFSRTLCSTLFAIIKWTIFGEWFNSRNYLMTEKPFYQQQQQMNGSAKPTSQNAEQFQFLFHLHFTDLRKTRRHLSGLSLTTIVAQIFEPFLFTFFFLFAQLRSFFRIIFLSRFCI